ncbi:hypothetical protein [Erythrobacter sp. MTPC3]|uniref:hypothetical protein n=1 Tax=Erythrobacter sp. MTPC3 TaxID=3056564 RepID=UPI0036F35504
MVRLISSFAAIAALAITPAAMAKDELTKASANMAAEPVKLVEFDGEWAVLKTASRLRIWRTHIAYTLTVNENGDVTGCAIDDDFRRAYVKQKMCSVLLKHHTFEPARDAADMPVAANYSARLSFQEMRDSL